jgi:hypothetical protein
MARTIPPERFAAVVATAARVFILHGYQRSQVQDVANALGLAKAPECTVGTGRLSGQVAPDQGRRGRADAPGLGWLAAGGDGAGSAQHGVASGQSRAGVVARTISSASIAATASSSIGPGPAAVASEAAGSK